MVTRTRGGLALDLLVGLMALIALSFVVRERVVPWIEDRSIVDPGELVGDRLSLEDASTGDSIPWHPGVPTLLVVFRSTCPACGRAIPTWVELSSTGLWRTTAVGLEPADDAARYAGTHLPLARAAVPRDIDAFVKRFRIRVVPTTLVIDREGRLAARHAGPLEASDVKALRRLVAPSNP